MDRGGVKNPIAAVAQVVEHRLPKPVVEGSSPFCRFLGGSAKESHLRPISLGSFCSRRVESLKRGTWPEGFIPL